MRALDLPAFRASREEARASLACLPDPAPAARAALARLDGAAALGAGDREGALRAFRAARALDPDATLPPDLFPPDHPAARLYALAAPDLRAPPMVTPEGADALVSTLPAPAEPPSEGRSPRAGLPFLLGAAASGLLSGGLYALSQGGEVEGAPGDSAASVAWAEANAHSRRLTLRAASGGSAALSAGLLALGITARW